jgi:hypothetical protein
MTRKPDKRRCARTGCRAWTMAGSPFCHAHRRLSAPAAPSEMVEPAETTPASLLGIYAGALTPEELRLFDGATAGRLDPGDVEPEIWLLRVMSRRLFIALARDDCDQDTVRKLAGVLYQGIARLAQLLRTRRALSGEAVDGLAGALAQALDEIDALKE